MSNNQNSEFADYLWMGDEMDNFDQQMEAEFEEEIKEEEFIKSCIEQLLDEEEEQTVYFNPSGDPNVPNKLLFDPQMFYQNSNQQVPNEMNMVPSVTQHMQSMYIQQPTPQQNGAHIQNFTPMTNGYHPEKPVGNILSKSKLNPNAQPFSFNPNAQEFVPKGFTTRPTKTSMEQPSHTIKPQQRYGSR